ncbi:hypothetical protein BS50DRAFT_571504 [Corynespora cassiicola Philippines]|uniref:Uncharacterized protein n=1 Tax=Corynespora cassiicola Philippines TaxID=1448308 RepID=A0A2T2NXR8_CORCC|nr:hypothetical protein BS50DRAFT_571504 [Corynespora cassiicola Philippines]
MTSFRLTRTRERSPYDDSDAYLTRPSLLRRDSSKRQKITYYDDDDYDDYPGTKKSSRALTIRQPTALVEKYNIMSSRPSYDSDRDHDHDYNHDHDHVRSRYRYVHKYTPAASDREDDRDDGREFRLKVKATFGRPKSSSSEARETRIMDWPADAFKRKEKWEHVDWETRERERRGGGFWDDEDREVERRTRFFKVKRTKTEEYRPLKGFRRV